ncbi:hypothetical protein IEQ34_025176 [Dendrobium chrysotoxum]|uniref:Calponin-homology (CH) domain-containing protein n=1 Tax=Dendrobium chrysotoxum TaxID=161865 RepID=A0AAV7FQ57_DENCH|nr:hypothetical protein IEQ34_025176 [Dendrobium chrysotoxum]
MEAIKLQRKYPQFSQEEMMGVISRFRNIDIEEKGSVDKQTVMKAIQDSGDASYDQVRETLKEVNLDASGRVELDDYVDLLAKLRAGRNAGAGTATKGKMTVQGSNASVQHTINEDERTEFTRHINSTLAGDVHIGKRLPIPQILSNCSMTAKTAIGCSVVNVGAQDLIDGREHLILGLIWQIIRRGLLSKIDLKNHPELYRLLDDGEALEDFLRLPPDQILLRWFNYHLKAANWQRKVTNFSKDVSDGENYTVLLSQLRPDQCDRAPLQQRDLHQRAEMVLQRADTIGCRKYLTPTAMVAGNPKLNLAFVAHLFNTWPCLEALETPPPVEIEDFDAEGEREARVFTLWLNSLDVDPGVYNLFEDLKDGTVILQAFDKVVPGSVAWRRVSKPKEGQDLSRFKMVENTNYAVDLAKLNNMHIVGIQGADIVDGTRDSDAGTCLAIDEAEHYQYPSITRRKVRTWSVRPGYDQVGE